MARPWLSEMKSKLQDFHLEHLGRLEPIFDEHICVLNGWLKYRLARKHIFFPVSGRSNTRTHIHFDRRQGPDMLLLWSFSDSRNEGWAFLRWMKDDLFEWQSRRALMVAKKQVLGNRRVEGNQLNTHQWILRMITGIDVTNALAFVTLSPYVIFDYEST